MSTLIALLAGLATGAVMRRGGLCFNRAVRRAVFERRPTVLRAFAIAIAAQLLVLPLLVAAGVGPLARNAEAGGLALLPVAQVAGGLVFGAGMALAGGCVTGMLWKTGAGSAALGLAIAGFAAGELLARGAGDGLIAALDDAWRPGERSLAALAGVGYEPAALGLGAAALLGLLVRRRDGLIAGLALGAVAAVAWIAADLADYGYGLGFVGAAQGTRAALDAGGELPYQLWLALGVVVGGALGARPQLRRPDGPRAARAVAGGLLMGAGGSIAHGCNIGHVLTGVPLLSLGSMLAGAAMIAGVVVTWRLALGPHPALRGVDRVR